MSEPLKNGWYRGNPSEEGMYLRAFDEWDDESDAELFEYRQGKWFKEGKEWFCYGGVFKPTSPQEAEEKK